MQRTIIAIFSLAALLAGNGCLFAPERTVVYHEIAPLDATRLAAPLPCPVIIGAFANHADCAQRFRVRTADGPSDDPFNKWASQPELLVETALKQALRFSGADARAKPVRLAGEVRTFEIDLTTRRLVLAGNLVLRRGAQRSEKAFAISVPLADGTPAAAAQTALAELAKTAGVAVNAFAAVR